MEEQELKELIERAEEVELQLWKAVCDELTHRGQNMLGLHQTLFLLAGLLTGTIRPGPQCDRQALPQDLREMTDVARSYLEVEEVGLAVG